jgi:hypothetical protein
VTIADFANPSNELAKWETLKKTEKTSGFRASLPGCHFTTEVQEMTSWVVRFSKPLRIGAAPFTALVWKTGKVLLLVNERGDFATAQMTETKKFTVKGVKGWDDGLVGEIANEGKEIAWANGSTWKRP